MFHRKRIYLRWRIVSNRNSISPPLPAPASSASNVVHLSLSISSDIVIILMQNLQRNNYIVASQTLIEFQDQTENHFIWRKYLRLSPASGPPIIFNSYFLLHLKYRTSHATDIFVINEETFKGNGFPSKTASIPC